MAKLVEPKEKLEPKVGQLIYSEYVEDDGEFARASLLYIDTAFEDCSEREQKSWQEGKNRPVTWVAQMEDYSEGAGMEVYTEAVAGGSNKFTRIATDDDIQKFVDCIASGENPTENLNRWIETLKDNSDHDTLQESEKERLISIISAASN